MTDSAYGSQIRQLPTAIRSEAAKVCGIHILNAVQSRTVDQESLNKFPALAGAILDFSGMAVQDQAICETEADFAPAILTILNRHTTDDDHVVVLWGSFGIPSVEMPMSELTAHLASIVSIGPHFWIYAPRHRYLIECLIDGTLTGVFVP